MGSHKVTAPIGEASPEDRGGKKLWECPPEVPVFGKKKIWSITNERKRNQTGIQEDWLCFGKLNRRNKNPRAKKNNERKIRGST